MERIMSDGDRLVLVPTLDGPEMRVESGFRYVSVEDGEVRSAYGWVSEIDQHPHRVNYRVWRSVAGLPEDFDTWDSHYFYVDEWGEVLSGTGKGPDGQTILLLPIMDSHVNWRVISGDYYDYLKWPSAWDRFCREVGNSGWRAG